MSRIQPVAMPKMGIEMIEGTIAGWRKQPGEAVAQGDEVVEIESDKIINVWESPVDGVLRRQLAADGDVHKVGVLIGVIAGADVSEADIDAFIAGFAAPAAAPAAALAVAPAPAPVAARAAPAAEGGDEGSRRVSPVVRRLAEELGVDLDTVQGSGRNGRITTEDVERAASTGGAAPAPATDPGYQTITLSPTRRTIGKRLSEAKQQIPHFYLETEYAIDGLLAHRERLNAAGGTRISVNDLVVGCVARALLREPRVNINFVDGVIQQFSHANVAVAIATDEGLYAATIRNADTLSPAGIAEAGAALADRARRGALRQEDITGGSFTVSNLGMFGVRRFVAIINPPMGAILALGRAEQRPVVREGQITVATLMSATLSCDHRVIDGAVGAQFLKVLGEEIAALA